MAPGLIVQLPEGKPFKTTLPVATVQVHLGGPMNNSLESLERVIEVIGQGEAERIEARNRWKQYATMGHALSHHDVSALRPQHG